MPTGIVIDHLDPILPGMRHEDATRFGSKAP
jgi:hypothetical protein